MILSDTEIRKRLEDNTLGISPLPHDDAIQPASIDLHLAADLKIFYKNTKELGIDTPPLMTDVEIDYFTGFTIPNGAFFLGSTIEEITVPEDLVGVIDGKSSLGRIGLAVHVTAGYIDPGFHGNLTLELRNLNPDVRIRLNAGMAICQIRFHPVCGRVARPYGSDGLGSRYQDSVGTVPHRPKD